MARLIQRGNEINLEEAYRIKSIEINYSGSFVGEIIGETDVILSRNKLFINFIDSPRETIMIYEGNFRIKNITARLGNEELINIPKSVQSNEWERVMEVFSLSATKWKTYSSSTKYPSSLKTLVAYTNRGNKKYATQKSINHFVNLNGTEFKKINRLRGDYDIR
tara:strand:+ start:1257 stop:1748 length:492 start_codon:yes stop_codon:yes gene_type:complete